jgi:ABC-type polysaccharide transport system permease subunit
MKTKYLSGISAICLILTLPFFDWIKLANLVALFSKMGVTMDMAANLYTGYNLYNLLSFVQYSGQGTLGLFAMVLLILVFATLYFNIAHIVRDLLNERQKAKAPNPHKASDLPLLAAAKTAFLFGIFTAAATIAFTLFANIKYKVAGFIPGTPVFLILAISVAAYVFTKKLEKVERARYNEHGFAHEFKKNWVLFLMLVPTFVYFMINNYLPMLGVYFAFTSFNFRDGLWASPFTGFKNFEFLMKADLFRLTKNTILYNVVFIGVGNALQIIFAILVSKVTVKWFKKTSQTLMFMPYFVSFVILKVIVYNVFEYQYGLINNFVTQAGAERIDFYNTPSYWPFLITFFYLWKNIGYGMVVYLATIMGIDNEIYEAAKVDGAGELQQIRYITLPHIRPTFIILLLYALGSIMKGQFELFYQLIGNNGVLFNVSDIFDTYVYRITTTQPLSIGLGTAAGLYQSIFGFLIIVVVNFLVKKKNPEYALF